MNFDCVFVNGDSYSAPITQSKVYAEYISEYLKLPLINIAVPGSNNDRILRSSLEFLSTSDYNAPLILIGWSFIRRLEVWYYGNNQKILNLLPDKNFEDHKNLRLITLDLLLSENEATLEQKSLINEDLFVHKQLIHFYTNLFLFSEYLQKRNLTYFFFSAAKNNEVPLHCFPSIENLSIVRSVSQNPNIYQLHDFFIMDWAKTHDPKSHPVTGHLSPNGHQMFAKYLLALLPL